MIFKAGISTVEDQVVESFYKGYKGFIRRMEDDVKSFIRKNQVLKSRIALALKNQLVDYAFKAEIDKMVKIMIEEET